MEDTCEDGELYEKILQARAKAKQLQTATTEVASNLPPSQPESAVVDDAVDEALGGLDEPEEDNYKTLPCSRKMRDEPAEGIFFAWWALLQIKSLIITQVDVDIIRNSILPALSSLLFGLVSDYGTSNRRNPNAVAAEDSNNKNL